MPSLKLEFDLNEEVTPEIFAHKVAMALAINATLRPGESVATVGGGDTFVVQEAPDDEVVFLTHRERLYTGRD